MGIPFYFYTVYNKYNIENDLVIKEQDIKSVDYLFLDYNSMIHPCAQQILKTIDNEDVNNIEPAIINGCIDYTRYIVNLIRPKYLYIMIDGVAPMAKINQQRERRYRSYFIKRLEREHPNAILKNNSSDSCETCEPYVYWDSNNITPGTVFMDNLYAALCDFKNVILNDCNHLCDVIISGSDEPGEGEHKNIYLRFRCRFDNVEFDET